MSECCRAIEAQWPAHIAPSDIPYHLRATAQQRQSQYGYGYDEARGPHPSASWRATATATTTGTATASTSASSSTTTKQQQQQKEDREQDQIPQPPPNRVLHVMPMIANTGEGCREAVVWLARALHHVSQGHRFVRVPVRQFVTGLLPLPGNLLDIVFGTRFAMCVVALLVVLLCLVPCAWV